MTPTYGHMTLHYPHMTPSYDHMILPVVTLPPHDPYLCWDTVGLLEQWLIEGNYTEEEALTQSIDMLAAGVDTVSKLYSCVRDREMKIPKLASYPGYQEPGYEANLGQHRYLQCSLLVFFSDAAISIVKSA